MAYKRVYTAMGRKVIHHSPAKFPASTDPSSADEMDKMVEQAAKQMTGTYSNMRKETNDALGTRPIGTYKGGAGTVPIGGHKSDNSGVADYMKRMLREKKK